jgi:hypothetical protein
MQRCCQVYEKTHKSKFPWMECFEILEKLPKWNAQYEVEGGSKQGNGNSSGSSSSQIAPTKRKRHRARNTGKRQKALSDKIDRMLVKHNAISNGGGGDRLSAVGGTLNQMTSHMVEQLNFAHWTDEDKSIYFTQDAMEKALQQKKRILILQRELEELQATSSSSGLTAFKDGNDEEEDEYEYED